MSDDHVADFNEFAGFEEVANIARSITNEDRERHAPPPDLWAKINAGVTGEVTEADTTVIDLSDHRQAEPDTALLSPDTELSATGGSLGLSPRLLLVAAASALLLLLGGGFLISGSNADPNVVYAAEISNADLPEAFDGAANVTLEIDDAPMLMIDFADPLPTDEPIEVWIISADGTDVVPVGMVEPGTTTWDWPEGFSPEEYPLVDLSIEPDDGNPEHSGRSILRGELVTS